MAELKGSIDAQTQLIAALRLSQAWPHPVADIEVAETHISWVLLTGSFAYKIKKAVKLEFLDFSTLERRRHFCDEELRLNRRWAPDLYLEVVPICGSVANPVMGGAGEAIEYAVKMLQFPQSAQLDHQLDADLLREADLEQLAETVAGYHRNARIIEYGSARESVRKVRAPMLENFLPLEEAIDMRLLSRVEKWTRKTLRALKPTLIARRKDGFVRECHGDLHLANLARLPSGIAAFDCVEFSAELRNIDVISDIAFLFMDLVARARQDLAAVFLNRYLERTGDYAGMQVFGLYFVYHCMIRAKVAAIRSTERSQAADRDDDIDRLKHNLAVAARWIDRHPPRLIAMHGYSGSGKTWLSSRLVSHMPAIRLRSDIERKREFSADNASDAAPLTDSGRYSQRSRAEVYEKLFELAELLLSEGLNVIIDASFLRKADRDAVTRLADRCNVAAVFVDTAAHETTLINRLESRGALGRDASDADVDVLRFQVASADALTEKESSRTVGVATDKDVDIDNVVKRILGVKL